jgi:hypothetical protein
MRRYTQNTLNRSSAAMKFKKNQAQADELQALAKSLNVSVRDMLLSDEHFDASTEIFFKGMPRVVRMTMSITKFRTFFKANREKIVNEMYPLK